MRFLRTNTAVIITVGPFYDRTDGVTIKTALTITNERITLTADTDAGSAPTNILDNVTGATSGTSNDLNYITGNDAGMMQLELSAANVNRLGRMFLSITDAANHVPVFHEFMVVPALVYDTFFASSGGATFPAATLASVSNITAATGVDITKILGTAISTPATAGILDVNVKNIDNDAASASGTVTFPNATLASTTNISAGTITTATNVTTVNGLAANVITAASMASDASAEIATTVWQDATAGDFTTASSIGKALYIANVAPGAAGGHFIAGTNAATSITTALTANITGNLSGSVGSVTGAVGSVTAGVTLAASAVQAIWDALTSALTTVGSIGKKLADWTVGTIDTYTGNTKQTGDAYARLGAPVGASISADIAGVQSDTDNIQTRIPAALVSGRIDASVGAMATDTLTAAALATDAVTEIQSGLSTLTAAGVRSAVGLASANLDTQLATLALQTSVDDLEGRLTSARAGYLDNLSGGAVALASGVTVTTNNDKTGYTLSNAGIDALFTRQLTEAYNTDGSAPTVAQALMGIMQTLTEFSISGTTLTVKKLDGTTTALTLTLSDATNPAGVTRAS